MDILNWNGRFGIEKSSLAISRKILRFTLEAQLDPQKGHADKQRGLPQCVAAVPYAAAAQQRTPITGWEPSHIIQ